MYCSTCGKFAYNAPRTETGREIRSIRSRENIDPSTRARILTRDNCRCVICGRGPAEQVILHIGHLISVDAGHRLKLSDDQINSDENLAAMCEEDNLGLGAEPVPLRMAVALLHARLNRQSPAPFTLFEHGQPGA